MDNETIFQAKKLFELQNNHNFINYEIKSFMDNKTIL